RLRITAIRIDVEGERIRPASARYADVGVDVVVDMPAADQSAHHRVGALRIGQQAVGRREQVVGRGDAVDAGAEQRESRADTGRIGTGGIEHLVARGDVLVRHAQAAGDVEAVADAPGA